MITGVSGSWRYRVPEGDVEMLVTAKLELGRTIVTGGALGVDYRAAQTALAYNTVLLKVILPTSLNTFLAYHWRRADEGVITRGQAAELDFLLSLADASGCVIEHPERKTVGRTSYYARNQDVVDASDELLAFQVNLSRGTGDTIRRAKEKGIPVTLMRYKVDATI